MPFRRDYIVLVRSFHDSVLSKCVIPSRSLSAVTVLYVVGGSFAHLVRLISLLLVALNFIELVYASQISV
uniref:Uncharacterized protein n=1 Tax=Physcomitrium patens TaxID=3218 RepID=A0A2K1KPU8_PHYPA|nr:hypothetical protein PHYPA_006663 [Physcomitrium patens]